MSKINQYIFIFLILTLCVSCSETKYDSNTSDKDWLVMYDNISFQESKEDIKSKFSFIQNWQKDSLAHAEMLSSFVKIFEKRAIFPSKASKNPARITSQAA